ncbi:MAG: hypothetical protein C4527_01180 [Candidatus Omnitrophota bacterium]|jgi:tellurite resistance protein|nr:MAG: hypothetical protein C4527_01180 [Candidatus Omnitrophota bacterium]
MSDDLFTLRKSLDEICTVPDKIISVYSLEKHVWADSNSEKARKNRMPELQSIVEFQIDPVRPFLTDILRNIAAPYKKERKDNPIGQGYWIQAEFGSGKSHLLCMLSALALGRKEAWNIIQKKEKENGRGKRDSLYHFWEEGIEAKSSKGKKGIFVIVKTLVGTGGGTIGLSDKGQKLTEYILDAAKEQIQLEMGKNISLYPTELLADRFLQEDLDRYRTDLRKFLRDPKFLEEDEFEDVDDFVRDIQQNKSPEYKRSCGNKLWRFYTEYLKVKPHIAAESEDILKHMVETILAEGYSGVLLVLDEVSLFMKNRDENQRTDDEKTLVVLSNRLAKVHNLPIWTVCAAQQAIESKMGVKNILADDRLKLVKLLEEDKDYYDIVLARVREIKNPGAIGNYYLYYKRGFSWPNSIGESDFRHFFPFHRPAIEVLRAITYELTTTRSAIHFMHQTLKHQMKHKGDELIRLWELFDEAVRYEEDPSGVHAGLVAIKTKRETDYKAYESCKSQIDGLTKGYLKVHRDKAVKIIQTLFLYHIARTRQQGITSEDIANSVLIERDSEANADENNQHYETIAENLKKELRQIVASTDENNRPRYRFDPVFTGVDPRDEFKKVRDDIESNEVLLNEAWNHLLALDEWPIRTRQMTIDLSNGNRSIFRDIAQYIAPWEESTTAKAGNQNLDIIWQGRHISGLVGMRDFGRMVSDNLPFPMIDSDQTDRDFSVFIGIKHVSKNTVEKLLSDKKDPRILLWTPGELTPQERDRLLDFAAYRKLISDWQGKETEDALAVVTWVHNTLQTELGKIAKIVDSCYGRGRFDSLNNSQMDFHVAGELPTILTPLIDRVLTAVYESRDIKFEPPFVFRKEEGVKVINGIVKTGRIPKGAKPNQNISAAQNFGFGLHIIKKSAEKELDVTSNRYVEDIWSFLDDKLADEGQSMKIETLYKNFMGIGGPRDYGLTRRMVQIFLLCLVREGRIRIGLGSKSGLPYSLLDYSNIADVDFSAKVLDSFSDVQKMAKPENWEVLRPYAEKLLNETIPSTHDDAVISEYRSKLRELFSREKEELSRFDSRVNSLFENLKTPNPYDTEFKQIAKLFRTEIENGDDINLLLYGLKESLKYQAFDSNTASQTEVDDLANRLKNYRDLKRFMDFESDIRAAHQYCACDLPHIPELQQTLNVMRKVTEKLTNLRDYIDSEVKLKTELLGKIPPDSGETGTLSVLIKEYTMVYIALHESVVDRVDEHRKVIQNILEGDELEALKILEEITALQPPVSSDIVDQLNILSDELFVCSSPSRTSIEEQLRNGPVHDCELSFQNAQELLEEAELKSKKAASLFDRTFDKKVEVFLNPTIQKRLQQGKSEKRVAELLACANVSAIRSYLAKAALQNKSLVETINRYLKQIVVKRVKMSDFKPSVSTIEKEKISELANEFEKYLETQFNSIENDADSLPMLQIE